MTRIGSAATLRRRSPWNALQRAERELKRVLIVTAEIRMPNKPTLEYWEEGIHAKPRRNDYVGIVNDTPVLVGYGAQVHESNAVAESFTFILKQALKVSVAGVHIYCYPADAHKVDDLLAQVNAQGLKRRKSRPEVTYAGGNHTRR